MGHNSQRILPAVPIQCRILKLDRSLLLRDHRLVASLLQSDRASTAQPAVLLRLELPLEEASAVGVEDQAG